jgi:hypothetical protein
MRHLQLVSVTLLAARQNRCGVGVARLLTQQARRSDGGQVKSDSREKAKLH